MEVRNLGRRLAFQFLFMTDLNPEVPESIESFAGRHSDIDTARTFACHLVTQYRAHDAQVGELLKSNVTNYDINRIAAAERSVLRLAVSELLEGETPYRVVLDEAIKLARKFGSKESPRFVNGVLDAVVKSL